MARKDDNPVALLHARKETNFQNTEIGPIPRDWEVETIANEFKFLGNNTLSRDQLTVVGSVQNVHYGDIHVKFPEVLDLSKFSLPYINESICRRAKEFLRDGDIVMADTAEDESVGKSCEIINIGDRKVEGGLHTFVLRPFKSYYNGFLGYLINSTLFHNHIIPLLQGTKVYSITKSDLKTLKVIYPPLEEQKRIAEVLSHFDQHIENLSALLEKKKQIKSAAMHQLLSGLSLQIMQLNTGVRKEKVGAVCLIERGVRITKDSLNSFGRYPVYSGGITPMGYYQYANRLSSTVTVVKYGSAGFVNYVQEDFWANDVCYTISPNSLLLSEYLYYTLKFSEKELQSLTTDAVPPHLPTEAISSFQISIPPIDEQRRIVRILSNMDKEIGALEQLVEKYQQLKEGAMQELLTGKTRLL